MRLQRVGAVRPGIMDPHQRGFGVLAWLLIIPVVLIAVLILTFLFYEGRKVYWDAKVREMCEKDGGVTVYERIPISTAQAAKLPKIEGSISIPHKSLAAAASPLISTDAEEILREWGPKVVRRETTIMQQIDGKVVGKMVSYARTGGDLPTGISEGSSFACPEYKKLYAEQARFFVIEEAK